MSHNPPTIMEHMGDRSACLKTTVLLCWKFLPNSFQNLHLTPFERFRFCVFNLRFVGQFLLEFSFETRPVKPEEFVTKSTAEFHSTTKSKDKHNNQSTLSQEPKAKRNKTTQNTRQFKRKRKQCIQSNQGKYKKSTTNTNTNNDKNTN